MAQLLTDEELKKYEDLVWFVYNRVKPNLRNFTEDDWFQIGIMEVAKAMNEFDSARGKVSTFLYMRIKHRWLGEIRSRTTKDTIPDYMIINLDNREHLDDWDALKSEEDVIENTINNEQYKHISKHIESEEEQMYYEVLREEMTQREVAENLGLSQSTVCYRIEQFKLKILKLYRK